MYTRVVKQEERKNMTNEELIKKIKFEVLGNPLYGFEDMRLWDGFIQKYFTREGIIQFDKNDQEIYSARLNEHLSSAALFQTLTEIRKRLDVLLEHL